MWSVCLHPEPVHSANRQAFRGSFAGRLGRTTVLCSCHGDGPPARRPGCSGGHCAPTRTRGVRPALDEVFTVYRPVTVSARLDFLPAYIEWSRGRVAVDELLGTGIPAVAGGYAFRLCVQSCRATRHFLRVAVTRGMPSVPAGSGLVPAATQKLDASGRTSKKMAQFSEGSAFMAVVRRSHTVDGSSCLACV